ncbi:MAG: helix-turn-helix transcriptional regulator [Planctomycetota bacterium]|jgi:excisionase family DNA binding protein
MARFEIKINNKIKRLDMRMTKRYANIKEISEYTSIPVKTLYEWSSVGKIPCIRLGRKLLFDLHDIDQLMAGLKRNNKDKKTVKNIVEDVLNGDL